jgi:hypothetical protein
VNVRPIWHHLAFAAVCVGVAGCGARAGGPTTAATATSVRPPIATTGQVISRRPSAELRRRGAALSLTSARPRAVTRACATAAAKSRTVVYCPPLVPTGRTLLVGVDGALRSRDFRSGFVANFQSDSVRPSGSAPGHWTIAEGDPRTLRSLLYPPNYDPRAGSIEHRPLRIGGTSATLWLMPSFRTFHGIYGGHTAVSWQCEGREYHVSMHGHTNRARAVLIATALADALPTACRR